MRIGQVSKKYDIPIERLYYYINYGIIVPERVGSQYNFTELCLKDIERMLKLKSLGFSLKDIHKMLSFFRISKLIDSQDVDDLVHLYQQKRSDLLMKIDEMKVSIVEIDSEIEKLKSLSVPSQRHTGFPLRGLSVLACPTCQTPMTLKNVEMNNRYIYTGKIECDCGYHAHFVDGILHTHNKNTSQYDYPDTKREYYKDIPPSIVTLLQKSYNWNFHELNNMDLKNCTILETHVNAYFLLQSSVDLLNKDALYIVVDKFPETLKMYKEMIEKQNVDLDILYIADSGTSFPLRNNSVDLLVDYFSSNEHCFFNQNWLIPDIVDCLSPEAKILGTFFYFMGNKSIKKLCEEYPEAYRNNFNLNNFMNSLKSTGFSLAAQEKIGCTENSGSNAAFSFHVGGEKMCLQSFLAKRTV